MKLPLNDNSQLENYEYGIPFYKALKPGIYLLEYHDVYLKDALISQLAENWSEDEKMSLFVQSTSPSYTLKDLFLCRELFKQNPHDFPSLYQHQKERNQIGFSQHSLKIEVIEPESKHPKDFLETMFEAIYQNPAIKLIILDSQFNYLNDYNFYPQLSRLLFNRDITILFSLSDIKDIVCEFELEERAISKETKSTHFTLRLSASYVQEG